MHYQGLLKKMNTEWKNTVQYILNLEDDFLVLNQCIGKKIKIKFKITHKNMTIYLVTKFYQIETKNKRTK